MISKSFTILGFLLYFCSAIIFAQTSTEPSLFPHRNNFSAPQLYCLGGQNENDAVSFSVSRLNTTSNQWKSVTEMSTPKYFFGAATIGKKIYVCGGSNENKRLELLEVFDCEKNTWTELSPMQKARDDFGMNTLNQHIYVVGGRYENSNVLSSVLIYSPETNTWSDGKSLNEARYHHELITLNGVMYAIGGYNTKTVERYSPLINQWSFVASTQYTHENFGATSHQNKIYVLSDKGFEVFHPELDTWQNLPSLNIGNGLQLVSVNDRLWAMGVSEGNNKSKASKTVYEFDTTNNSWIHLPDMDAARKFYRAVVVDL